MSDRDTVEDYWARELGVPVMIREWPDYNEVDLYVKDQFRETFVNLEALERWLERYVLVSNKEESK